MSYPRRLAEFAREISKRFADLDYDVFLDVESLKMAESLQKQISDEIDRAEAAIVLVDDNIGEFQQDEIQALRLRNAERGTRDFPVFVADLSTSGDLPTYLRDIAVWRPDDAAKVPTSVDELPGFLDAATRALAPARAVKPLIRIELEDGLGNALRSQAPERLHSILSGSWLGASDIDAVAEMLANAWRRGDIAWPPDDSVLMADPSISLLCAETLQSLAMAVHLGRFYPEFTVRGTDQDLSIFGVSRDGPEAERDALTFDYSIWHAEWLYGSRITEYLLNGTEPDAARSLEDITNEIEDFFLSVRENSNASPPSNLRNLLQAFELFAPESELALFRRTFGDATERGDVLETLAKSAQDAGTDERSLPWQQEKLAQFLQPYSSPLLTTALMRRFRGPPPLTFVEEVEHLHGQLLSYLRALADNAPESLVLVDRKHWHDRIEYTVGRLCPELLDFADHERWLRSSVDAELPSDDIPIPIQSFYDIFSTLGVYVLAGVRNRPAVSDKELP